MKNAVFYSVSSPAITLAESKEYLRFMLRELTSATTPVVRVLPETSSAYGKRFLGRSGLSVTPFTTACQMNRKIEREITRRNLTRGSGQKSTVVPDDGTTRKVVNTHESDTHTTNVGSSWKSYHSALLSLSSLRDGWDGFSAPKPSALAIRCAQSVLSYLPALAFHPEVISATAEGGVGISFSEGDRYASFELCNDGEIVLLMMVGNSSPITKMVYHQDLRSEIRRVQHFIRNARPTQNQSSRPRQHL